MARVHIIAEGSTEKNFVNHVLEPYLAKKGVYVDAHSITTRKDRRKNKIFRGGLVKVDHLLKDVKLWLQESEDQIDCWVTTMVDLYGFPYAQKPEWVGGFEGQPSGLGKAEFLEKKLSEEFSEYPRFIPYVQLHEFEALLLVDTSVIHSAFEGRVSSNVLTQLNKNIGGILPEAINQGQHTAPSKRIIKYYPEYEDDKPTYGSLIAGEIGIDKIRKACPHFNDWISRLEILGERQE